MNHLAPREQPARGRRTKTVTKIARRRFGAGDLPPPSTEASQMLWRPTGRATLRPGELEATACEVTVGDDPAVDYPWLANRDDRFTLALVLDVGEVLVRQRLPAPAGATLVDLTTGLYRALHPTPYLPPPLP